MSNFMQDAVVAESLSGDVWKAIVRRYAAECRVSGDGAKKSKSAKALKDMVNLETEQAREAIQMRPFVAGETDAERERHTGELLESLERAHKNVVKNYLPVIIRAEKDGVPLFQSNGLPVPKSALEKAYKEASDLPEDSADKDPFEVAQGLWRTLKAYCNKHSLTLEDVISE